MDSPEDQERLESMRSLEYTGGTRQGLLGTILLGFPVSPKIRMALSSGCREAVSRRRVLWPVSEKKGGMGAEGKVTVSF